MLNKLCLMASYMEGYPPGLLPHHHQQHSLSRAWKVSVRSIWVDNSKIDWRSVCSADWILFILNVSLGFFFNIWINNVSIVFLFGSLIITSHPQFILYMGYQTNRLIVHWLLTIDATCSKLLWYLFLWYGVSKSSCVLAENINEISLPKMQIMVVLDDKQDATCSNYRCYVF